MEFKWLTRINRRDILIQRHHEQWSRARTAPICPRMTEVLDSLPAPKLHRPQPLDRLDIACLAWAGVFAVVTAGLVIVLR